MNILLGCTGRGGEQCIFSAIVAAYKERYPDAHITVAVCPEFVPYWHHDRNLTVIPVEHEDPQGPYFLDPVGRWSEIAKTPGYDIVEFACEYGNWIPENASLANTWAKLKNKPCEFSHLRKRVALTPSDEDIRVADEIRAKYGDDLMIISPKANTASTIITRTWYEEIAKQLGKYYPVATTGKGPTTYCRQPRSGDVALAGTIDLVGQSVLSLYAMSSWLQRFLGPDTATCWLVANMPGRLMTIRGDATFPLSNTGLVANGFRDTKNTLEFMAVNKTLVEVVDACLAWFV